MTGALSTDSTVVVDGDHLTTELEDELVILDGETDTYYGLNEVGRRIWERLEEPRSVVELRDAIVEEYDVGPQQCERDLLAVLEDLRETGLVSVVDS